MYQIYTQDQPDDRITKILKRHETDYTLTFGEGCFRGKVEPSLTITLDDVTDAQVMAIAKDIQQECKQQEVLVRQIFGSSFPVSYLN